MSFTGNGITNCYPDQVEDFISITVLTVIGIPFGIQHFKLAGISLMPVGKTIVPKQIAAQVRQK